MASTEAVSSMMDESLIATEQHTQISPVLLAMGIKVRNEHCNERLKNALDDFNAQYLNAMEFLTQILPVAKQQFGKKDNVFLPKTPGKKRPSRKIPGRAHLVDISELSALDDSDLSIKASNDGTTEPVSEPVVELFVIPEKPAAKPLRGSKAKEKTKAEKKIKLDSGVDKENCKAKKTVEESKADAPVGRTTRSRNQLVVMQLEPKKNMRRTRARKKASDERIEQEASKRAAADTTKASESSKMKEAEEIMSELEERKPRRSSLRSSSGSNDCDKPKRVSFGDDTAENSLKRSSSASSMKPEAKRTKSTDDTTQVPEVTPSISQEQCVMPLTSDKGQKRKSIELTGVAKRAKCDDVEEKPRMASEEEKPSVDCEETARDEEGSNVEVCMKTKVGASFDQTKCEVDQTKCDSGLTISVIDHTKSEMTPNKIGHDHTKSEVDHSKFEIDHSKIGNDHTKFEIEHSKFEIDHSKIENDQSKSSEVDHTKAIIGQSRLTINLATPNKSVATPKRIIRDTFVTDSAINVETEPETPVAEMLAAVTPSTTTNDNGTSRVIVVETPDISRACQESTFTSAKCDNGIAISSSSIVSEYGTPSQTTKQSEATSDDAGSTMNTDPTANSEVASGAEVRRSKRSSVRRVISSSHGIRRSSRRMSTRQSKRSSMFKKSTTTTASSGSDSEACSIPRQVKTEKDEEIVSPITKIASTSDDHEAGPTTSTPEMQNDGSDSAPEGDVKIEVTTECGPATSTPDIMKPRRSLRLTKKLSLKAKNKKANGSVTGRMFTPKAGKVAGMIREINDKNSSPIIMDKQSSMYKSPAGNARFFSPMIKRSTTKPSNIVGGDVRSFINRPVTKKVDPDEVARMRKLELLRKQEKEKERVDQAEQRRKVIAEEHKRKREEKQKRVNEAKAAREKEEQEKKLRQMEEKKHLLQALEQAKKKKEIEEENKKKLREQRKKEADARRLKENEERMKRIQEKEEEERVHREILKRKQEHDEQERKQRIQEEKRLQEQKQRERQREKEEERERKLREIKEKEAEKMKEEAERKEKERKQKEAEDREKKRIALLIKERMEKEKRAREEKERRDREELAKRLQATKAKTPVAKTPVAPSPKPVLQTKTVNSYAMTPPYGHKPSTDGGYNLEELRSDDSTDDEDCPRQKVPQWAQGIALKNALLNQDGPRKIFTEISRDIFIEPPKLEEIFVKKRRRFFQRTSSAHWDTPPMKKICT